MPACDVQPPAVLKLKLPRAPDADQLPETPSRDMRARVNVHN